MLINGGTASAAEVVAGALHADAGAVVVGRPSYGKGTVQAVEPLAGGGALKLTVARFTLRGGLVVEGRGIRPTIAVDARPGRPTACFSPLCGLCGVDRPAGAGAGRLPGVDCGRG